jgi:hypothetical protein
MRRTRQRSVGEKGQRGHDQDVSAASSAPYSAGGGNVWNSAEVCFAAAANFGDELSSKIYALFSVRANLFVVFVTDLMDSMRS